ncbi:dephospho-CoA kinase [Sphingomonas sp. CGMCC 1.13654]|uniref:Dephospho-CoA kinase n=1 Tax=Sphingomonas chungangi TaxID=2683589 RepID=A0A838L8Y2_9SPHN|nr:dephospho-CoA kinase [Sphingomonas chungangi]MBA2935487.1 dephospho-CoA kinase [Sphingomonas chungangi]MVW56994.1 dephospho-CoA kinase [Sphingomonas chungangi]
MIVIGLTGSIGMGKSTVAAMFRAAGVPVFDADAAVHELQGPGGILLPAIEAAFPGVTGLKGVDRIALGKAVFGNRDALRRLERIVHPAVHAMRRDFVRRHRSRAILIDDVPLLFEKRGERRMDATIVVSAPAWMQRKRVLARPGMSQAKFTHILRLQVPDREKRRRADFVIDTGTTRFETRNQVMRLLACLRARGIRYCRPCAKSSSTPKPPA